jgi:hypothetical protein
MRRLKMKYTQEQIEAAVEKVVGDWDIETLMTFCIDETVYYYTGKNVSEEEIDLLMEDAQ